MRALHALTNGDLLAAAAMNPATLIALPYLIFSWSAWVRRAATGKARSFMAPGWVIMVVAVLITTFWVLRNLPGFEFLGPVR